MIRRQLIIDDQSRGFIPILLTSDLTNSVGRDGERERVGGGGTDFLTRRQTDRGRQRENVQQNLRVNTLASNHS